jgi:hypothetical protein
MQEKGSADQTHFTPICPFLGGQQDEQGVWRARVDASVHIREHSVIDTACAPTVHKPACHSNVPMCHEAPEMGMGEKRGLMRRKRDNKEQHRRLG